MSFSKTLSRKDFIKIGSLALAGTLLPKYSFGKAEQKIGLQLYTLRNEIPNQLERILEKVSNLGYSELELFGYTDGKFFGKTPKEFKGLLKKYKLKAPSGHYLTGNLDSSVKGTLKNDWERAVADAAEIGQKYVVCAYLFPEERTKLDDYKHHIELFNKSAEISKKNGLQFIYHNHDFEFQPLESTVPYDLILKETDADLVQMELDLYWTAFAGVDPVIYFEKHPGRFPLWHLKDMEKTEERAMAEVGNGSIDFQRIFDAQKVAGLKHYFVEQDFCKRPALEAIEMSINNVKKLKI